jgi:spore maturation protein CgeB
MGSSEKRKLLSEKMANEWERRIKHDHRFWMSDGYLNDEAMWSSGERDYSFLLGEVNNKSQKTLLEIGSGVGRILRAAAKDFKDVVGYDVAPEAQKKAEELLRGVNNIKLITGDGFSLSTVEDKSIDVVASFAALSSMPTAAIASYLLEANRVLKEQGEIYLQLYVGVSQSVGPRDTLNIRCFTEEQIRNVIIRGGFAQGEIRELKLPFQVSFEEVGIKAVIVSAIKNQGAKLEADELVKLLSLNGEEKPGTFENIDLEYWMSLNYARELARQGELDKARSTLEYAESVVKTTTLDVGDILNEINSLLSSNKKITDNAQNFYAANMLLLREKFPKMAEEVDQHEKHGVAVRETEEGATLFFSKQALDHPTKPSSAAKGWVDRTLQEGRIVACQKIVVFGLAGGYHIQELLKKSKAKISVIEPNLSVLKTTLERIDLRSVISQVEEFSSDGELREESLKEAEIVFRPQYQVLYPDMVAKLKSKFYSKRGVQLLKPTYGVLSPIMGGTLPITGYTLNALKQLGMRQRELDVSGFLGGYHQIEKLIADKFRASAVHSSYLQMISHVILESVNEKPVDIMIFMAQAPLTVPFLTELKKRGVITVLWFVEDYLRFTYWKDFAKYFDYIFTIQREKCIEALQKAGAGEVHYLPVACDPEVHVPVALSEDEKRRWGSPVSFVGAGYHNRQQMFASMADLPFKIWGTEWPSCRPFDRMVQEGGRRLTPNEYIKIFCSSEININLHSSTERDGIEPNGDFVNPRTIELAASGAFQLVDKRSLLPEILTPEKEVVTFDSLQDLREKINFYLNHPAEREKITLAARKKVLGQHTYKHRIESMISTIYASRFEQLRSRLSQNPWAKMLDRSKPHSELYKRCKSAFERGEEPNLDGLIADIVTGSGKLTETEQKLLFLFHVRKQIVRHKLEDLGDKAPEAVRRGGL